MEIKWQNTDDKKWYDFPLSSINHNSVEHACYLFSNKPLVIAKDDNGMYVVNDKKTHDEYRKKGKKVTTFENVLQDVIRRNKPLEQVGFVRPL